MKEYRISCDEKNLPADNVLLKSGRGEKYMHEGAAEIALFIIDKVCALKIGINR
jgi:hypothetical protein